MKINSDYTSLKKSFHSLFVLQFLTVSFHVEVLPVIGNTTAWLLLEDFYRFCSILFLFILVLFVYFQKMNRNVQLFSLCLRNIITREAIWKVLGQTVKDWCRRRQGLLCKGICLTHPCHHCPACRHFTTLICTWQGVSRGSRTSSDQILSFCRQQPWGVTLYFLRPSNEINFLPFLLRRMTQEV